MKLNTLSQMRIGIFSIMLFISLSSCNDGSKSNGDSKDSSFVLTTPDGFPTQYLNINMDVSSESYRPGRGLKTGTYEVVQCAIDTSSLKMNSVAPPKSGETFVDYKVVEDFNSLKSFMGLNMGLNANIGWFSMEASLNKMESSFQNSFSICLVAKVYVTNSLQTMAAPRLFPEAQALLLKDPIQFYTNYGDRFIHGLRTGGELYIVYEFYTNSSIEKKQLVSHLKMKASGLTNSLQAVVGYTKSLEAENKSKKMSMHIYRKGDKSDLPDNDVAKIIEYVNSFPKKVDPTEGAAFITYTTIPYTEVGWTTPIANKQKSLDSIASLQRKVYQLLSWKQEKIKETLKDINFALNKTFWNLTPFQNDELLAEKKRLEQFNEKLNNCYNTCKDITQCYECKKIIYESIKSPQFDSYTSTEKYDYNSLLSHSEITHYENTLCKLEPNRRYKLVFNGNLLAPGNIPFDAFVSNQNNSRAIAFNSLGTNIVAYPVVCIRVFGLGEKEGIMVPVNAEQKSLEIITKNIPVTIMGVNRYYIPGTGIWQENTPIYLTPTPGWTWPTLDVYKWEKL